VQKTFWRPRSRRRAREPQRRGARQTRLAPRHPSAAPSRALPGKGSRAEALRCNNARAVWSPAASRMPVVVKSFRTLDQRSPMGSWPPRWRHGAVQRTGAARQVRPEACPGFPPKAASHRGSSCTAGCPRFTRRSRSIQHCGARRRAAVRMRGSPRADIDRTRLRGMPRR